jgi:hypothetical protein
LVCGLAVDTGLLAAALSLIEHLRELAWGHVDRESVGPALARVDRVMAMTYCWSGASLSGTGLSGTSLGCALEDAQAAVDEALVAELAQADEDPYGHDLAAYRVFSHPDVIWPGSDMVWYGAHDRATGALAEIYPFN